MVQRQSVGSHNKMANKDINLTLNKLSFCKFERGDGNKTLVLFSYRLFLINIQRGSFNYSCSRAVERFANF